MLNRTLGYYDEAAVIEQIAKSPYERLSQDQYDAICTDDYYPGTFCLSERIENPPFLFDEATLSFHEWFYNAINGELNQMCKSSYFEGEMLKYGRDSLIEDTFSILFFHTRDGKCFCDIIANQEYSDYFRRIILFLLFKDSNKEIRSYVDFNLVGLKLIPSVLEGQQLSLRELLIQSIYSGLIGMDIKDELAATSPLSRSRIVPLKTDETDSQKVFRIRKVLEQIIIQPEFQIDSWCSFEQKVVQSTKPVSLCWFTDDYIPTMFEMKFMEALLQYNANISITIIPRIQSYSNDASWLDVQAFLELPVFSQLKYFAKQERFRICKKGLDVGTFNGRRLSHECADIVINSDYVVIAGARSYEMGQGLKKHCFFTGIAVCRTYSETVTGVCVHDGGIVFLEQLPNTKSFEGFKGRFTNRKYCSKHSRWYPVADKTALDYVKVGMINV